MRQNSIYFFGHIRKKLLIVFNMSPQIWFMGFMQKKSMNFSIQNIGGMKMLNGTKHKDREYELCLDRIEEIRNDWSEEMDWEEREGNENE